MSNASLSSLTTNGIDPSVDDRAAALRRVRRLLIKVGSAVLRGPTGLDVGRVRHLAEQIGHQRALGREVLVVSSGAILAGMSRRGLESRPTTIPDKQAAAAVGQSLLMRTWDDALNLHGLTAAQVLLTADDLAHRHRYLNARHTLRTLLDWGCIPVINENDTVRVDEIKFGDNDQLAALIAVLVGADLTVFLSDVDALYDGDPKARPDARALRHVPQVDADVLRLAGAAGRDGTGGMGSKLLAARRMNAAGIPLLLAPGREPLALDRALAGEPIGTFFAAPAHHVGAMKHWLAHMPRPQGDLVLDAGAARALRERGTSLLPVGVREVRGAFGVGAAVRCLGPDGDPIGVGLVNYDASEIAKILGCRTADIESRLGYRHSDEVIHRDHFALVDELEARVATEALS